MVNRVNRQNNNINKLATAMRINLNGWLHNMLPAAGIASLYIRENSWMFPTSFCMPNNSNEKSITSKEKLPSKEKVADPMMRRFLIPKPVVLEPEPAKRGRPRKQAKPGPKKKVNFEALLKAF